MNSVAGRSKESLSSSVNTENSSSQSCDKVETLRKEITKEVINNEDDELDFLLSLENPKTSDIPLNTQTTEQGKRINGYDNCFMDL